MASAVIIDKIEDLDCVERQGVVRNLTRGYRVRLRDDDPTLGYAVLDAALKADNVPKYGDRLAGFDPVRGFPVPASYNALVVAQRDAKMEAEDDTKWVRITVKYEHVLDGPNQKLVSPPRGIIFVKGRSSVSERETNYYYPYGLRTPVVKNVDDVVNDGVLGLALLTVVAHGLHQGEVITIAEVTGTVEVNGTYVVAKVIDIDHFTIAVPFANAYTGGGSVTIGAQREQIVVSHTYPLDHSKHRNECIIQGGEIKLPYPQNNVRFQGYHNTNDPEGFKDSIHNCVNAEVWLGKPARSWLITEVEYDVLDPAPEGGNPRLYRFEFEAQNDSDGWDRDVVFKDPDTGQPPASVIRGSVANAAGVLSRRPQDGNTTVPGLDLPAGAWTVPALLAVNFTGFFGAAFG